MTQAPHLLGKSREGFKYGDVTMTDHMAYDGLFCAFDQVAMGASTEKYNDRYGLTRAEQDEFSARSHQRAAAATEEGDLRRGDRAGVDPAAQGRPGGRSPPTRASAATPPPRASARLRPAFSSDGTITAGSASQISDGAAAVVVMSKAKAEELGLSWLAEIGAHGVVAGPDPSLHEQPANAISKACAKEGIDPADLDLVEINEAFAAVGVVVAQARRSTRTRSTSTAARSRSATRSACPAPASRCTWRWSSSAAAAGSARPRCAAAAARATR